ncbi:MAG: lipoyl synthase [Nitrospirae bacterium]|nr:lipoyl synthase [Nitrospirota bacterium]
MLQYQGRPPQGKRGDSLLRPGLRRGSFLRLPEWIKTRPHTGLHDTKQLLRRHGISTVCEDARCPNRGECFSKPTATFLILGPHCTRNCGFCAVTSAPPVAVNVDEPEQVAGAAAELNLKYVVVTSVTRDDLTDGGAGQFAETIRAVKRRLPKARIEVLTPDFRGDINALKIVLEAEPNVFNHNMETVQRLYPVVRQQADYRRSLSLLKAAKELSPATAIKSGFMLGLGETMDEVVQLLADLRRSSCDFITIGQYLRPTKKNLPVVKYIPPDVFDDLNETALRMGFRHVASGPLVRSSINAEEMYNKQLKT